MQSANKVSRYRSCDIRQPKNNEPQTAAGPKRKLSKFRLKLLNFMGEITAYK